MVSILKLTQNTYTLEEVEEEMSLTTNNVSTEKNRPVDFDLCIDMINRVAMTLLMITSHLISMSSAKE